MTWQGWVIVCVPLGLIVLSAFLLPSKNPTLQGFFYYLGTTCLLVVLLILITAKLSPKPKWRWGRKHTDNPDEDF